METSIKQDVLFRDLGRIEYQAAWDYQEKLLKENVQVKIGNRQLAMGNGQNEMDSPPVLGDTTNYLLFVEHPPVYTLGKSGAIEHVLINEEERAARGIGFYHTNRGGDITFH